MTLVTAHFMYHSQDVSGVFYTLRLKMGLKPFPGTSHNRQCPVQVWCEVKVLYYQGCQFWDCYLHWSVLTCQSVLVISLHICSGVHEGQDGVRAA